MRRNELTSCIALGGIVILAAVLALRFDLASLLFPDVPATTPTPRASSAATDSTATQRASSAGVVAPLHRHPVDDRASTPPPSSTFDVVRIDPEGASVFAGRAPANANVTVLANDKPVATAKANEDGQWATVIDRQFTPGDYQLSLTAKPAAPGTHLKVGDKAPDFSLRDQDRKMVKLSDFKGKTVVLAFYVLAFTGV